MTQDNDARGVRARIARCIREQRRCAKYIRDNGFDAGAWQGICDWTMEEAILRCQN